MNNILDISFDKNTAKFTFKSKTKNTFKASITVSDVHVDCVYFLWEDVEINSDFSGWIAPLSEKLVKVVLNNPTYPGFNLKYMDLIKDYYILKSSILIKLHLL